MKTQHTKFDYTLDYRHLDLRKDFHLYRVGVGEQGVLLVEPYKSEILPFWRFKNPEVARHSAQQIYILFLMYLTERDFVGADMARKFLQMGFTRARRYANHSSGKKYVQNPQKITDVKARKTAYTQIRPQNLDWKTSEKALSAKIFFWYYLQARNNTLYKIMKRVHQSLFG